MAAAGGAAIAVDWVKLQREGYGFVRDEDTQDDGMCWVMCEWSSSVVKVGTGCFYFYFYFYLFQDLLRIRCRNQVEAVLSSSSRPSNPEMEQANGKRTPL